MKKHSIIILLFVLFVLIAPFTGYAKQNSFGLGPISVRNQFPLALLFYTFEADSAYLPEEGSQSLKGEVTYSSIFERNGMDAPSYNLDLEISRLRLEYKKSILNRFEIATELAYVSVGSGFLDSSIKSYHEALDLNVESNHYKQNQYSYYVNAKDININFSKPGQGISDFVVKGKYLALDEGDKMPALSLKGALKFPIGKKNDFTGSGSLDAGASLLLSKNIGSFVNHLNLSYTQIINSGIEGTRVDNAIFQAMFAIEWVLSDSFSALAQLNSQTLPFPKEKIDGFSNLTLEETFGFKYMMGKYQFNLAFTEDTSDINFSPDFSMLLSLSYLSD